MRLIAAPISLLLGLACAALVACGGSGSDADLIPANRADRMQSQLDRIRAAVDDGSCSGVANDVAALQQQVNNLPNSVDSGLRRRLQEGVNNLAQISPDECFANADAKTQTETTPTETTPTDTTPTDTTPTETTPTEPPPTTEPPVTTPPTDTTTPPTDGGAGGATVPSDQGAAGGASPTP